MAGRGVAWTIGNTYPSRLQVCVCTKDTVQVSQSSQRANFSAFEELFLPMCALQSVGVRLLLLCFFQKSVPVISDGRSSIRRGFRRKLVNLQPTGWLGSWFVGGRREAFQVA